MKESNYLLRLTYSFNFTVNNSNIFKDTTMLCNVVGDKFFETKIYSKNLLNNESFYGKLLQRLVHNYYKNILNLFMK